MSKGVPRSSYNRMEILADGSSQEKILGNPGIPFSCQKRFSNNDILWHYIPFAILFVCLLQQIKIYRISLVAQWIKDPVVVTAVARV